MKFITSSKVRLLFPIASISIFRLSSSRLAFSIRRLAPSRFCDFLGQGLGLFVYVVRVQAERDRAHFYFAIRSILHKLTKGNAPDTAQMNARVREMIASALQSEGVEDVLQLSDAEADQAKQNIFDDEYLQHINRIKLPNTKIKLPQMLLQKAIGQIRKAFTEGEEKGLSFEETAFYDILKSLCVKYHFTYPEDKLIALSKRVKILVDEQAAYPDWDKRDDIKSALKVDLIILLDEFGYPPVERDEVYGEVFEQAENFKKGR